MTFISLVMRSKKKNAKGFFINKENKDQHTIFYKMPNRDLIEEKDYIIDCKAFNEFSNQAIALLKEDIPDAPYLIREGFLKDADIYCRIEFTNIGVVGRFDYDRKEPILMQGTLF